MQLELHPLCTLFPRITGAEFNALKNDISANGLRQPIVVHQGLILDGGNRYRACVEAGIEPATVEFAGGNLVSFVLSANLHRRHMSPGQQAAIVASAQDWGRAQTVGRPINAEGLPHFRVADRAAISGATERTQRDADKLVRSHPDLAVEVMQGRKSLYRAVKETKPEVESEEMVVPAEEDEFGPSEKEIEDALKDETAHLEFIKNLLANEDDPLTKALAEVKMCREQVRIYKEQNTGLQNEKNQLIRTIKSLQAKLRKLEVSA